MRSERSWFNSTLFLKNLTRFWPIWGLYLVIWLLGFPINLLLDLTGDTSAYFAEYLVIYCIPNVGVGMALVFSLPAAMAVWSYLYSSRSAAMMHTLPIRREGLFLTNYLSGLTFLAGPTIVVFLLTILAEMARGYVYIVSLCMWLACMLLMEFFFFSFATICAMFTGHILCLPAFYAIFNGLAAGLLWLLDQVLSMFVFGYAGVEGLWRAADWLTPVWKLATSLYVVNHSAPWLVGLGYIIIYALFGVVLTALALVLYRRREMERAGDVITVKWMRPVFQYGVAFCCALTFGSLLFVIFSTALPATAWTLLFFMLLFGAIGYFIARMLLEKTFRVFYAWKGCVCFLAALVVLTCVMEFDLTGYERRVPSENQVASVYILDIYSNPNDTGRWLTLDSSDPEAIQTVLDLHRAVVRSKGEIERYGGGEYWDRNVQLGSTSSFQVTYRLENGKTVTRSYNTIPVTDELLADPDSPAAKMQALINMPQARQAAYGGLEEKTAKQVLNVTMTIYSLNEDHDHYEAGNVQLPEESWDAILTAVQADLAGGNLGRRYLMDNQERRENCYLNDLTFEFYVLNGENSYTTSVTIGLQTTATHTLQALEDAGVLKKYGPLVTHTQRDALNDGYEWDGPDHPEDALAAEVPPPDDAPAAEFGEESRTEEVYPD